MPTEEIEAALARLMPPALSQQCQLEIEDLFNAGCAAGHDDSEALPAQPGYGRWLAGTAGIAAALAAVFAVFPAENLATAPTKAAKVPMEKTYGLVLVGESDRIESMTDEGWQEDSDGTAMHALRLSVVEENSLRDEETGIIVHVSEPREEILFTPITAF